jgi:hypothetical protein
MTEQLTRVSPYLTAFHDVKAKQADGLAVDISAHGRAGFGNEFFRVRYGQDLISKTTLRFDLGKLGSQSEAIEQYIAAIKSDRFPWTELPADFELPVIPMIAKIDEQTHLDESLETAKVLFEALQPFPRRVAFMRQWNASGKGQGIELILVLEDEGVLDVLELSVNFYRLTQQQLMLRNLQRLANNPNANQQKEVPTE